MSRVRYVSLPAYLTPGFFYVTGHGLPFEYLQSLLKRGHEFFELPQEKKDEIHIFKSMDRVRGYQRIGENVTYAKRDQQEVGRNEGDSETRHSISIPSRIIRRQSSSWALSSGRRKKTLLGSKMLS
jgi:isopenicillin N synthase-like dioxygenase